MDVSTHTRRFSAIVRQARSPANDILMNRCDNRCFLLTALIGSEFKLQLVTAIPLLPSDLTFLCRRGDDDAVCRLAQRSKETRLHD
jgi:hypothetical protein